ncbi:MAG: hypothetical protein EOM78_22065 [Erysipelotrichia bacterium]|nr:hypothetical protein [Erysipelotrichia bacterium]
MEQIWLNRKDIRKIQKILDRLNRKDIRKIQKILDKFPEVESFELLYDCKSGIGTCIRIKFQVEMNETIGDFLVPVSSIEDW